MDFIKFWNLMLQIYLVKRFIFYVFFIHLLLPFEMNLMSDLKLKNKI